MNIRPAAAADVARLVTIDAQGATRWSGQTFADLLTQRGVHVLVVEEEDVNGFVVMREVADEAEIYTITVDPNHRRRGLGGRLLDACHQRWIAGDIARGHLEVRASNEGALALYTRGGWTPSGRRGGYYSDGEDAVTLTWRPPKIRMG